MMERIAFDVEGLPLGILDPDALLVGLLVAGSTLLRRPIDQIRRVCEDCERLHAGIV
jgi:hypothetical protein